MTPQTEALRIKSAPFPALKTLEKFDFTFQRSIKKQVIEQLGRLDSPPARENVILLVRRWRRQDASGDRPGNPRLPDRDSACCSAPPPNGLPCSPTPNARAAWRTRCVASSATRCWSEMRSATSHVKAG